LTALNKIAAGSRITASEVQAVAPLAAYKSADQSITSSAVLTNDSALFVSVLASATYYFKMYIKYEGGTQGSADMKIGWAVPTGTTMSYERLALNTSGAADVGTPTDQSGTPTFGSNGAGNSRTLVAEGTVLTSTTAGTLQFKWAQGTSNGTATIVHAGSALVLWQIA
jgi:hypothetical protein